VRARPAAGCPGRGDATPEWGRLLDHSAQTAIAVPALASTTRASTIRPRPPPSPCADAERLQDLPRCRGPRAGRPARRRSRAGAAHRRGRPGGVRAHERTARWQAFAANPRCRPGSPGWSATSASGACAARRGATTSFHRCSRRRAEAAMDDARRPDRPTAPSCARRCASWSSVGWTTCPRRWRTCRHAWL